MKRSPLTRKTPLRRKTRVNPRNTARQAKLHAKAYHGPFEPGDGHDAWIRKQDCVVWAFHRCSSDVQACHLKTRGAGGDWRQQFPGCFKAHEEQEGHTKRFEQKYGIDLSEVVRSLALEHLARRDLARKAGLT